jgi:receptor expression-enhancing protein 5/6
MDQVNFQKHRLEMELNKIGPLQTLERYTHVPKFYLALSMLALAIGLVFMNVTAPLIVNIVGFAYPAYISLHNIEYNKSPDNEQWYTYWIIFGMLSILDTFSGFILRWFHLYYISKLLFFVFLMHPQYQGAKYIYNHVLPKQWIGRTTAGGIPLPPPPPSTSATTTSATISATKIEKKEGEGLHERPASSKQTVIEPVDEIRLSKKSD